MEKIKLTKKQLDIFQMWNEGLTHKEIARELEGVSLPYVGKTLKLVFERLGLKFEKGMVNYARRDLSELKRNRHLWERFSDERKQGMMEDLDKILLSTNKLKEKVGWY